MNNPYSGIDWNTIQKIVSTTHCHCKLDDDKDKRFASLVSGGLQHFAITN